jgi:predicted dehydrogenase/nucleoside-diphosphate-sugar epimerase
MDKNTMPRIAFVGCGNIAHIHMRYLLKLGYSVHSVCDSSITRAKLFAKKYGIENVYTNINELIVTSQPSVLHVLTPPHTHFSLIKIALQGDCNVFVEKPICQTSSEYSSLLQIANEKGLSVCVDHTRVFNPDIVKARNRIDSGEFGKIVSMNYSYDDPSLIVMKDDFSWQRGTPSWFSKIKGGVLVDLLPHPLSVLLSFDSTLDIDYVSSKLLSETCIKDLRILLKSETVTAQINLSLIEKPLKNTLDIYCENGTISIDLRNMHSVFLINRKMPSILCRLVDTFSSSFQQVSRFSYNMLSVILGRRHPYDGLDVILESFYNSILTGDGSAAIDILNQSKVTKYIDHIVSQAGLSDRNEDSSLRLDHKIKDHRDHSDVLVFGGSGFIGKYIVDEILNSEKTVRIFSRQSSRIENVSDDVDIHFGDIKNIDSLQPVIENVHTVIHSAAAMSGDWAEFYESTVLGTENILSSLKNSTAKKFIYISSLGVIDYNSLSDGDTVSETSLVEKKLDDRGFYTRAKVEAENLVLEFARNNSQIETIILRPGLVYGLESNQNIQNCGVRLGKFLVVFGIGKRSLGTTYVKNLADAVSLCVDNSFKNGEILHVVDEDQPSVRDILRNYNSKSSDSVSPLYMPAFIWRSAFAVLDTIIYFKTKKIGSYRYKFSSNSKKLNYSSDHAKNILNWTPQYDYEKASDEIFER